MLKQDDPAVACRFEVFCGGLELGNGFRELTHADEQRRRFEHNRRQRLENGLVPMELDERMLAALESGLPECAGIAIGVDRLLMLKLGLDSIEQVLSFSSANA